MKVDKTQWKQETLGAVCSFKNGFAFKSKLFKKEGLPILRISNIGKDGDIVGEMAYFSPSDYKDLSDYIIKPDDVLVAMSGATTGKIAINKTDKCFYLNQRVGRIRPKSTVTKSFLYFFLRTISDTILNEANGVAQPNISGNQIMSFPLLLPSISEQQAISTELDAIQEVIDGYKAQLADLDALAQSIFLDTFGDPISNPKRWEKNELKKHASIGTGSTPSRKIASYYEGNIPWVKSTEVHNSYIYETQEHITQEAIDNSNCTIYSPNTILIAMYGQGKTRGQVGLLKIKAATNQACAAIYCKDSLDYLFCYWHFQICYEANRKLGNGTNQKNMNLSIVGNIKFIVPPLPFQQSFAKQVEAIEKQKNLLREQLKDAETLMAERMQYYFS